MRASPWTFSLLMLKPLLIVVFYRVAQMTWLAASPLGRGHVPHLLLVLCFRTVAVRILEKNKGVIKGCRSVAVCISVFRPSSHRSLDACKVRLTLACVCACMCMTLRRGSFTCGAPACEWCSIMVPPPQTTKKTLPANCCFHCCETSAPYKSSGQPHMSIIGWTDPRSSDQGRHTLDVCRTCL